MRLYITNLNNSILHRSEAGEHYNLAAKEIITSLIKTITNRNGFQAEEALCCYLEEKFKIYIDPGFSYETHVIKADLNRDQEAGTMTKLPFYGRIKLNSLDKASFAFKSPTLDQLGFMKFANVLDTGSPSIDVRYIIYERCDQKNQLQELVCEMELAGVTSKLEEIEFTLVDEENGFHFKAEARKERFDQRSNDNDRDLAYNILVHEQCQYGVIHCITDTIPNLRKLLQLKNLNDPKMSLTNGVLRASYQKKD